MLEALRSIFESEAARLIAAIAVGTILLGLAALGLALFLHWRSSNWAKTKGRITSSGPGFELRQRFRTEAPRNVRVASIGYEFVVDGKRWRSTRILDSGANPEDQVERLLSTYPEGASVTVHYDPRDPSNCALEIDGPPPDLAKGCLAATAIVVVCAVFGIWLVTSGIDWLQYLFPDALLQAMIPTAILGALLLILFVAFERRAAALRRWPQATGRIELSTVHQFQKRRDKPRQTARGREFNQTLYMPVVEYSYTVGGTGHVSRSIWDGTEVSGSRDYAAGIASRYPVGKIVMVRYDPADPDQAALEDHGRWHWSMLAGALVALGVSVATSGLMF